ncbi:uncharacterized protein F5891DRAFT_1031413 [Suillus fuscotomentosus]|uniref:Uncharacterized protein n=1 Tax=Suillus fuscotomentosus TaxID=1912939 RepID=A0AAD4E6X0_9AGAM|nr:uncharacterized protein F5891DRAFT_1031413 [Suillus fuscotomentosus]KAG1900695.1 hypothetical protein F5891DRAFT_1031413 [Suillus fuscotomentosus]
MVPSWPFVVVRPSLMVPSSGRSWWSFPFLSSWLLAGLFSWFLADLSSSFHSSLHYLFLFSFCPVTTYVVFKYK